MKRIITLAIVLILVVLPSVSAFFPITHKALQSETLVTYQGQSEFYEACMKHPDACYTSNVLTDFSVAWYFINDGENYIITHSPSYARAMLDNAVGEVEVACAVGSALHSAQDYEAHNFMIPETIRTTGVPNEIIHVFAEQHVDNIVLKQNPDLDWELIELSNDSWNKCLPLIKRTIKGFSNFQDEVDSGKFDTVLNVFIAEVQGSVVSDSTGYDPAFKNKVSLFGKLSFMPLGFVIGYLVLFFLFLLLTILLIFRKGKGVLNYLSMFFFGIIALGMIILLITALFGNAFSTFVFLIKPISNLVPIGSAEAHLDSAVQNGYGFFDEGEQWLIDRENPDASGFSSLREANKDSRFLLYTGLSLILLILILLIYFNFRRRRVYK